MTARGVVKVLVGAAVALCLFGLYESVDAAVGVFGPPRGPFGDLFDYPPWSLAHFVPGMLFMALTPFQLWARFRNRYRTLHRWGGRVVVASALFLGVSGVMFVFLMPARPVAERVFMLTFFVAFLFFLMKAFAAARRRDFVRHRAWMIRMFSTGLTITTQRLLLPVFILFAGLNSVAEFWDHFVTAAWLAWVIQLALAEWWIARDTMQRAAVARQPAGV
jgi:uncharacterized membrane protein